MRIYGTLKEVVALWLKGTGNGRNAKITVTASPSTDNVEYQLPDNSTNDVLVTNASSSILTNKTFNADGTGNSITNIENADIKAGAAIDATKIGAGTVDNTEFGYLNGVTSAIQTQLGNKAASGANSDITSLSGLTTALSIGQGGSGQTTANTALNAFLPSQTSAANKYLKSDGSNTSWASASGGAGEINAILNASGADGTTGWTGVSVVSGSSSPLNPIVTTAFSIANSATTESSTSGGYYPFTMPSGLLNRKLKVEFTFTTPATDVYRVSVYQGSTRVALSTDSSSVTTLPASVTGGKFTAYFDTDSNTSWTLSVTRTSGSTGACVITNVIVGPGIQPQGAVVGDWVSTTVTGTWSTNTTYTAYERRVGNNAEYYVRVALTGAPTATNLAINLPSGRTIDTTKLPASAGNEMAVGEGSASDTGNRLYPLVVVYQSTTQVRVWTAETTGETSAVLSEDNPFTFGNADSVGLHFTVPIAEWAGSGTVNLAQNDVEYASNSDTSSTASVTASGFAYGPSGTAFGSSWSTYTQWTRRVRFQTPIQPGDSVELEIAESASGPWVPWSTRSAPYTSANTSAYGPQVARVNSTDVDVIFNQQGASAAGAATYGANGALWSSYVGFYWRIRKSSAGAAVGFGIADTTSGLSFKNRFQRKVLSGNITADGAISEWSFSNLTVGKIYRLDITARMVHISSSDNLKQGIVSITHSGSTLYGPYWNVNPMQTGDQIVQATSTFVATATSITMSWAATNLQLWAPSYASLTEMNDTENGTAF